MVESGVEVAASRLSLAGGFRVARRAAEISAGTRSSAIIECLEAITRAAGIVRTEHGISSPRDGIDRWHGA